MGALRLLLLSGLMATSFYAHAEAVGTAFTYQGELQQQGNPANGTFDFQFNLFNVATTGSVIASTVQLEDVVIVDGVFTVTLDFGSAAFNDEKLWLEIAVRDGASEGDFSALSPRQVITPTPFALQAQSVPDGSITAAQIDATSVQARVTGACSNGSLVRAINADGSVVCEADMDTTLSEEQVDVFTENNGYSTGPHTVDTNSQYEAGLGLTLATGTFSVDQTVMQKRVIGACGSDTYVIAINEDGSVLCSSPPSPQTISVVSKTQLARVMTLGQDGNPTIATVGPGGELAIIKCNDIACAGQDESENIVDDPQNADTSEPAIAIGNDGFPVISYKGGTSLLKVAKCNDPVCSGGDEQITELDNILGAGGWSSIAVPSDGLPIIVHYSANTPGLRVIKCNDIACTGSDETHTQPDTSPNNIGKGNDIVIGNDDLPVISYHDSNVGVRSLKVLKCNDAACAGNDEMISTLDDPATILGPDTSIAIGHDGFPIISYIDSELEILKVAKCNDVSCGGSDETISNVLEGVKNLTHSTRIAIGDDGLPIIVFWSSDDYTLKVVKCNDNACAGSDETVSNLEVYSSRTGAYNSIEIGGGGIPIVSFSGDGATVVIRCRVSECLQ